MKYLLGVDFGGSSSKATLLGEDGSVYATASCEYPTYYPYNGWAEQDVQDSYDAMCKNIHSVLEQAAVPPSAIVTLALDAATHTAVLLDKKDQPIRRAIYWTDTRSTSEASELKATMGDALIEISYNNISSIWTLPQLMWLKKHEPETIANTRKILSVKDYLRYRLTGDYVTDSIEAMGFFLLDARSNTWSKELCSLAGISAAIMPQIVDPITILSPLCKQAQEDTGLAAGTLVIAGATDTAMEIYAAGAIHPGQATVKLATAGRICTVIDHAIVDPRLVTYRHVMQGLWYPGTATKSCAASNRWYRDTFGGSFDEISQSAAKVPHGCKGLFFHPYLQGEITPYMDDKLRASFVGAASFHTKAHFDRAVLEGVAYSMKDCFATLQELGIAPNEAVVIGGGAKCELWRKILADMLDIPLRTIDDVDSSLGSAMLAGVAVGAFQTHEQAVERCLRFHGITQPNPEEVAFYNDQFTQYKEIQHALAPIYQKR